VPSPFQKSQFLETIIKWAKNVLVKVRFDDFKIIHH